MSLCLFFFFFFFSVSFSDIGSFFFFAIFAVGVVILKGESFEKKMIREPRVLCENNPTDLGFTGAARERKGYIIVVK